MKLANIPCGFCARDTLHHAYKCIECGKSEGEKLPGTDEPKWNGRAGRKPNRNRGAFRIRSDLDFAQGRNSVRS